MTIEHSTKVKNNFEQKAAEYDAFMQKCVPDYCEILNILIDTLPFNAKQEISICDLGSGTGNLTALLLKAYPNAKINCVDISPMMSDMAKAKLNSEALSFEIADFNCYEFTEKYDIIISSLALHHLVSDEDKKSFYKRIYSGLESGGVFYNADIIISPSDFIENKFVEQWKHWLRQYHSEDEMMETVIDRYYEEDKPTTVLNHLTWLHDIGFREVDVVWKKGKGAIYGGMK